MKTLVDSSAWIEYLRGTGSAVNLRLRELLRDGAELASTDVVLMELLAGATTPQARADVEGLLGRTEFIPIRPVLDYRHAAALYRACRRAGFTPRQLTDCLLAAVAIASGSAVLHHDRDFDGIARHTGLLIDEPKG